MVIREKVDIDGNVNTNILHELSIHLAGSKKFSAAEGRTSRIPVNPRTTISFVNSNCLRNALSATGSHLT